MKKLCRMLAVAIVAVLLAGCHDTPNNKPCDIPDNTTVISVENDNESGFISLSKCQRFDADWGEEQPLRMVKWQNIKLSAEDAEKYPELCDALDALNDEEDKAAALTIADMREYPEEEIMTTLYANTEKYVLRADKAIVSILGEYEDYFGGAHGYYAKGGTNLSPVTGGAINLFDVVTDKDALYTLIFNYLLENYEGEFYEEKREDLYEHFDNGFNWSMDYNKINIYFNPYEIASYAAGLIEFELWFDEHPEMIDKKYTDAPPSYAVELSHFKEFKFDMDKTDGKRDVILVGSYGSEDYGCDQLAISLNLIEYTEDELYGVQFTPVLVCLEGKYYLYGEIGTGNGSNYINVYDLNGSKVERIETVELGFKKLSDYENNEYGGYYRDIPSNPSNMKLERYIYLLDTPNTAYKTYSINKTTALLETDDEYFTINEDNDEKITLCDIEVQLLPDGEALTLPEGTTLMPLYTDGESYMDFVFEAGQKCRVNIESGDGTNTVNGKDVSECFADKYFGVSEDNTGILSFEEASSELSEIYDVQTSLENGMVLVDYDMVEHINEIPHTCVALATDHEDHTVVEKIYAVAPESVYEYDAALDEWTAVGFG